MSTNHVNIFPISNMGENKNGAPPRKKLRGNETYIKVEPSDAVSVKKNILMFTLKDDVAIGPQNDLLVNIQRLCPNENIHVTSIMFSEQAEIEKTLKQYDHSVCMLIFNTHSSEESIQTGTEEFASCGSEDHYMSQKFGRLLDLMRNATTPMCKIILASCSAARYIAINLDLELGRGDGVTPYECLYKRPYTRTLVKHSGGVLPGTATMIAQFLPGRIVYATACPQKRNELTAIEHSPHMDLCGEDTEEINIGVVSNSQRVYVIDYDVNLSSGGSLLVQDMPAATSLYIPAFLARSQEKR